IVHVSIHSKNKECDVVILFLFFQAEDGIRYFHVTGVQTCALPIFPNGVEATLLVVVLFALEIGLAELLSASGLLADLEAIGWWGVVSVLANGLLFSSLLSYKKLSHRALFHSAGYSVSSTLGTLAVS